MSELSSAQIQCIEAAFAERDTLSPQTASEPLKEAVHAALQAMSNGALRAANPTGPGQWQANPLVKQAILLSFRINENEPMPGGMAQYYDKVPLQFTHYTASDFAAKGVRIVPPAVVRTGAFVGKNTVLMPSYVNIGAYIGEGTMVDTWATVGSCAQIGRNVHLSGGVGIGGVLEPLQATPTIIEDDCFIGARSEVVEGVVVEKGAVLSMGVFIGQSTKIYDRETDTVITGRVPAYSVIVPGTLPAANGKYALQCAVIVKKVDAKTRAKVGINHLLREASELVYE